MCHIFSVFIFYIHFVAFIFFITTFAFICEYILYWLWNML